MEGVQVLLIREFETKPNVYKVACNKGQSCRLLDPQEGLYRFGRWNPGTDPDATCELSTPSTLGCTCMARMTSLAAVFGCLGVLKSFGTSKPSGF